MRIATMLIAVASAVLVATAATAPVLLTATVPAERDPAQPLVPFELSGLQVTACLTGDELPQCSYPVAGLTRSPRWDGFHRAMYYRYLSAELAPCLRDHGFEFETPTPEALRSMDVSAWYLTVLLDEPDFETAFDAWYGCPLLPSYLEHAAYSSYGMVE